MNELHTTVFPAHSATGRFRTGTRERLRYGPRDGRHPPIHDSCGILPFVRFIFHQHPQSLPACSGRSALGRPSCEARPPGSEILLQGILLRAPHLHRASARGRGSAGSDHRAVEHAVAGDRFRPRWRSRSATGEAHRACGQPGDAHLADPEDAVAGASSCSRSWRGRLGQA